MSGINTPRVNWFDGQEVTETDLDVEQTAWHTEVSGIINLSIGSGVEKEHAIQRVLFDSDSIPLSVREIILSNSFDGTPLYAIDNVEQTIFLQPSDISQGNQLEVELSGSDLSGSLSLRIYIFGKILNGEYVYEVLKFTKNESQITEKYFTEIISIMTQDFLGNQNIVVTGTGCRNSGGRIRIMESLPMTVVRDVIMAKQFEEPNIDFINFKPSNMAKTLDDLINEISIEGNTLSADLRINVTATGSLSLDSSNIIIAQKFQATTNNIQKISTLLYVEENLLALSGHEYDWSGDISIGIRKLQKTTTCPTDTVPGLEIDFDPEPIPLAEISFSQSDLENIGVVLNGSPQVVDFVFTYSLLANPSVAPDIEIGEYYMATIRRTGDTSTGIILLPEAAHTNLDPKTADNSRISIFSQNKWTDISDYSLWFGIYTSAIRITDGTAYDGGVKVVSLKTSIDSTTGLDEPYIEGHHSLLSTSSSSDNYVTVQSANSFIDNIPHPSTGNPVATRIQDVPNISIVSENTLTTLISSGNNTIVLGDATDNNPVNNSEVTGIIQNAGLVRTNTITILNPSSDIITRNLVGSIITPNTFRTDLRYRIINVNIYDDAYGDINNDGIINSFDVSRCQELDGYSKTLQGGTILSADQQNAIISGTVTMEEIIRADVTGDGDIDSSDTSKIQQYISLGGIPFDVGSTFKRVVLTVENIVNPTTTIVDVVSNDSTFNDVPFVDREFSIEFVPLWKPENIIINDLRRFIPKTFTSIVTTDITQSEKSGGTNTVFVPNDLLLSGGILNIDGTPYSLDFEIGTIVIDLPEGSTQGEINIFDNFIKDKMKFYDGTYATSSSLPNNQIRVSAAIQSFVKDLDGYDFGSVDGYAAIDETIAILYTQTSGVLRIRANNIRNIIGRPELRTKIILTAYLKKAGFLNDEILVPEDIVSNLLVPLT